MCLNRLWSLHNQTLSFSSLLYANLRLLIIKPCSIITEYLLLYISVSEKIEIVLEASLIGIDILNTDIFYRPWYPSIRSPIYSREEAASARLWFELLHLRSEWFPTRSEKWSFFLKRRTLQWSELVCGYFPNLDLFLLRTNTGIIESTTRKSSLI